MNNYSNPFQSQWFSFVPSNGHKSVRLFCLPFAGGGTSIYYSWKDRLPTDIEVARILLPGRENRLRENAFTSMGSLIETLKDKVSTWLDRPFALFGHSMGALIAFELARAIRTHYQVLPSHMFVSGVGAPQLPRPKKITGLPDDQFISRLREYGGVPEQVIQHPELMEIFLPIFRADFELLDTYNYQEAEPLDCPLTAFGGEGDPKISRYEIEAWSKQTTREFRSIFLPGGHFFINDSQPQLLNYLSEDLSGAIDAR